MSALLRILPIFLFMEKIKREKIVEKRNNVNIFSYPTSVFHRQGGNLKPIHI